MISKTVTMHRNYNIYNSLIQKVYTCAKAKYSKPRGARGKVSQNPKIPIDFHSAGMTNLMGRMLHSVNAWKSMGILQFWVIFKERLSTVSVGVEPFLWISKCGLAQFGPTQWWVWPPSILSTQLDKSVYFLLGETEEVAYNWPDYLWPPMLALSWIQFGCHGNQCP